MDIIPEVYSDQFGIGGGPYGITMNFSKSPPEPGPGKVAEVGCRVRMSYEHAKVMAFIMCRQVKKIERDLGTSYPVPVKVLSELSIGMEDWDAFWKSPSEFRG